MPAVVLVECTVVRIFLLPDHWAQSFIWSRDCFHVSKHEHACGSAGTRDSQAILLKGGSGWVEHRENGILYCLDVTRCMFSSGNVTEKARMGSLQCRGETAVDLFAGIGYYTLPLLVHAGEQLPLTVRPAVVGRPLTQPAAPHMPQLVVLTVCSMLAAVLPVLLWSVVEGRKATDFSERHDHGGPAGVRHVYACEWNPAAAEALKQNLHRNGVAERCTVLEGDCTSLAPQVSRRQKWAVFFWGPIL